MASDKSGKSIEQKYDLILTYDYENLSTSIEETASDLKDRSDLKHQLALAGLKACDNKELTILAHSMGGLVSRWFIEQEGGDEVVDHLVMCGTPNNGSPFGKVAMARKIMNMLTTVALNVFPAFAPVGGVILSALNRSKKITPTLEQMGDSSDFMKKLNGSDDPGVRYSILAGDIHNYKDSADKIIPKLIEKSGKSFLLESIYGNSPHDIAVNLESIKSVDDKRKPAPKKQDVGCHHLNYFTSDAGLTALAGLKW